MNIYPNGSHVAYYNRGKAFEDDKNYRKALEDYEKAIELNPSFALAHNNLVHAYRAAGELEAARTHCQKATELGFQVNPKLAQELGCEQEE